MNERYRRWPNLTQQKPKPELKITKPEQRLKIDPDWLLFKLYEAYLNARKAKRTTVDEHLFEIDEIGQLLQLRDDIINKTYMPSPGIAFIVNEPVMREIFAASFRDRVVHHLLFNLCYDWWDKRFIYDSYSCRKGKGTGLGVKRMGTLVRRVSNNYQRETYIIKLDIHGYFMSLPRKGVLERVNWGLDQQFPGKGATYYMAKYLWEKIIMDDPTKGVRVRGRLSDWDGLPDNKSLFRQPPGVGIVIGNLTSQLVSNIYLDQLDRFVSYDLGYHGRYGRYVDDFFMLVPAEELKKAISDIDRISNFLAGIGLTLHPKKKYIQKVERGVPFLGAVIRPFHVTPGKRLKAGFGDALYHVVTEGEDLDALQSYLGFLGQMDAEKYVKKMLEKYGAI